MAIRDRRPRPAADLALVAGRQSGAAAFGLRSRALPRQPVGPDERQPLGAVAGGFAPSEPRLAADHDDRQGAGSLACDAGRSWDSAAANFVKVAFPAATQSQPRLEYRCEVTAIYPPLGKREKAPELCGFHRNWLNVFQLDPRRRMLANNTTSDVRLLPVRVRRYGGLHAAPGRPPHRARPGASDARPVLSGVLGYGLPNYRGLDKGSWTVKNPPFADTYPSLLISVADYVQGSGDAAWLKRNYPGVRKWADALLAMDRDGNGLFKYAFSGNWYALRDNQTDNLPANWWDAINYGHEDAYSNALAYRALGQMAAAAETIGQRGDAARCARRRKLPPPTSAPSSIRPPACWPDGGAPTGSCTTTTSSTSAASPLITGWFPATRPGRSWTG